MGPIMARTIKKLSPRAVATLTKPGRHSDGAGLYRSSPEMRFHGCRLLILLILLIGMF